MKPEKNKARIYMEDEFLVANSRTGVYQCFEPEFRTGRARKRGFLFDDNERNG